MRFFIPAFNDLKRRFEKYDFYKLKPNPNTLTS